MSENLIHVLLVEDSVIQAKLLLEVLEAERSQPFNVVHVGSLQDALHSLKEGVFDVILLDLTLPDSQGMQSLEPLIGQAPKVPIVVLTSNNDARMALTMVRKGAQDYLVKHQASKELLVRSLRYAIERQKAAALQKAKETLETQVQEQIFELAKTNDQLKQEIRERERIQQALLQEKELAQVTLQSISEAVIVTDTQGRIQSLNPVAETLTGWKNLKAKGRDLTEVLQLFDKKTHQRDENPIAEVLQAQCVLIQSVHILRRRSDNQEFVVEHSAAPICLNQGSIVGVVLVCRDITNAYHLANQLSWQASHDSLTGLINRKQFERHLEHLITETRISEQEHTLCYLDLDRFKIVNDTSSHAAGDRLLCEISAKFQQKLRKSDILARLGGDEFGLLLPNCSVAEAVCLAEKLLESIREFEFRWEDKTFTIGISIGLVKIDANVDSCASVLHHADIAMYVAKQRGGNRIHTYQVRDRQLRHREKEMYWGAQLVKALEENRFCLYSQTIVPLNSGRHQHHQEIFLRLRAENDQIVLPNNFLPAAERYSLMTQLDRWVIKNLFSRLQQANLEQSLYAINLSASSLHDDEFIQFLQQQFSRYQISPSAICFEIPEAITLNNLTQVSDLFRELKQLGCYLALDHVGRGMDSLTYLKQLNFDYLKFDGKLMQKIVDDPISLAVVEAINRIGHLIGLKTIAESVETEAIFAKIKQMKLDYGQGYLISIPGPLVD